MDNFFKGLNEKLKDPNLTREQKVKLIQQADDTYRQNVDKEYKDYRNKQILGAALEIGSAAIPFGGVSGQVAKRVIPKVVQKTVGRKLTTDTAAGAIGGALGNGMYGVGEGLMKGENPIKSAAKQAQSGFLSGGLLGSAIAKGENLARKVNTEGINQMRQYWGIPWQKASGDPQKAIDTLMKNKQGFVPNAFHTNKTGNVDLVWGDSKLGLQHIKERRDAQGLDGNTFIKDLPDLIKNGKNYGKQGHIDRSYIGDTQSELAIKKAYIEKGIEQPVNRNWVTSAYPFYDTIKNPQATLGGLTLEGNRSGKQHLPLPDLGVTDSINDYLLKHNPSQRLVPQIATFNTAVNSKMNDLLIPDELKSFLEKHEAQNKSAKKLLEDSKPFQNIASGNGTRSIPELLANNSINDYLLKHNPSQRLAPQIATFNTAVNSKMDDLLIPNELKPFLEKHEAQNKSARKHLGDLTPSENISSRNGGVSPSIPELLANNSINDYLLKHNPSQRLAPQVATFNTAVNSKMDDLLIPNELKPFLEKHEAQNKSARKHLGDLTPSKNSSSGNGSFSAPSIPELLATDSINDSLLKNNSSPVLNARIEENNFAGYKNPHSGSNRIFAAEEIGDFSTKEFTDYEPEIFAQINTPIGAPSRNELRSAIESSTAVYVEPYYKSDGSYVKGHYRAR